MLAGGALGKPECDIRKESGLGGSTRGNRLRCQAIGELSSVRTSDCGQVVHHGVLDDSIGTAYLKCLNLTVIGFRLFRPLSYEKALDSFRQFAEEKGIFL